jgi:hypothetical protein
MNLKLYLMSLSAALIISLPATANADAPQNYWGMGVDGLDIKENFNPDDFPPTQIPDPIPDPDDAADMNGFNLRYGFWFPFDLLGIEVRIGSMAEETGTMIEDPEVRYFFGMGKANIPFETVNLYVMGGVSKLYYDFDGTERDDEDVVAGVGVELLGTETTGLTLEFLKYGMDDDLIEGRMISLGFNHRFELPGFR